MFYRVKGEKELLSTVTVGSQPFPGFPARKLDPAFEAAPELYFALLAVPLAGVGEDSIQLMVRDQIGNTTTIGIPCRVTALPRAQHLLVVDRVVLEKKVEEVYQDFLNDRVRGRQEEKAAYQPPRSEEERLRRLRAVVEDYPRLVEDELKELFGRPKFERFWRGKFERPAARALPYEFGAVKRFMFDKAEIARAVQQGIDYPLSQGAVVRAVNHGVVVYADSLDLR